MVRSLVGLLGSDAHFLQQEIPDVAMFNAPLGSYRQLHEATETRGVVVADGFCIAEGLSRRTG